MIFSNPWLQYSDYTMCQISHLCTVKASNHNNAGNSRILAPLPENCFRRRIFKGGRDREWKREAKPVLAAVKFESHIMETSMSTPRSNPYVRCSKHWYHKQRKHQSASSSSHQTTQIQNKISKCQNLWFITQADNHINSEELKMNQSSMRLA